MTARIEKGIPLVPPHPRTRRYGLPWRKMKPGDSIACPADMTEKVFRQQAYNAARKLSRTFTVRKVADGLRAWRVGD